MKNNIACHTPSIQIDKIKTNYFKKHCDWTFTIRWNGSIPQGYFSHQGQLGVSQGRPKDHRLRAKPSAEVHDSGTWAGY